MSRLPAWLRVPLLFGWRVLGEHVAISDLLGIVPVAMGIYFVTRSVPVPRKQADKLGRRRDA